MSSLQAETKPNIQIAEAVPPVSDFVEQVAKMYPSLVGQTGEITESLTRFEHVSADSGVYKWIGLGVDKKGDRLRYPRIVIHLLVPAGSPLLQRDIDHAVPGDVSDLFSNIAFNHRHSLRMELVYLNGTNVENIKDAREHAEQHISNRGVVSIIWEKALDTNAF